MPLLLAALVAAAQAVPAPSPSFPCAGAATYAERTICGDAQLAAYDRAIARLYRSSGAGRAAQQQWLAERDRCRDRDCLLDRHEDRLFVLAARGPFPAPALRSLSDRDARVAVAPIGGGWFMFFATDLWIYPSGDNANTAETAGVFRLQGSSGEYRSRHGCRIRFDRLPRGRWRLTERGPDAGALCGGLNTGHSGVYGPGRK
jgi:uncharacterized protein